MFDKRKVEVYGDLETSIHSDIDRIFHVENFYKWMKPETEKVYLDELARDPRMEYFHKMIWWLKENGEWTYWDQFMIDDLIHKSTEIVDDIQNSLEIDIDKEVRPYKKISARKAKKLLIESEKGYIPTYEDIIRSDVMKIKLIGKYISGSASLWEAEEVKRSLETDRRFEFYYNLSQQWVQNKSRRHWNKEWMIGLARENYDFLHSEESTLNKKWAEMSTRRIKLDQIKNRIFQLFKSKWW